MIVTSSQKKHTLSQIMLGRLIQAGEQLASCPLGQMIFRGAHQALWTVETSVQWFVEPNTSSDQSTSEDEPQQPVRPLPWILFLPLLVYLRILKFAVNLIASLRGREPIHPEQVVKFLQIRRRHIRAIKFQGLKNFHSWKLKENQKNKAEERECMLFKICTKGPIAQLITFTGLDRMISVLRRQKITSQVKDRNANSLPDDESSDENEDIIAKLNRVCRDFSSEEDPDYEPNDESDEYTSSSDDNEFQEEQKYAGAQSSILKYNQAISKILACTQLLAETVEDPSEAGNSCNPKTLFFVSDTKDEVPQEALDTLKVEAGPSHNIDEDIKEEEDETSAELDIMCQSTEDSSDTKSATESSVDMTTDTDGDVTIDTTLEDTRQEGNNDYNESSSTISLESAEPCSEDTSQTYYSPMSSSLATPEPVGQEVSKFIFHEQQVAESELLQDQTFYSTECSIIEKNIDDLSEPESPLHSEKSTINIAKPDQQAVESIKYVRSISDPSNANEEPAETTNALKQSSSSASLETLKKSSSTELKSSTKDTDDIQKAMGRLSSFFSMKKKSQS